MQSYMAFRPAGRKPPTAAETCCGRKHDSIRAAVRCRWRCGRGDLDIVAVDDAGAPARLSAAEEQKVILELDMLADDYAEALGS